MGIQLMILAALFVAVSNFCMRRSIDSGGSSKAFLMIQLTLVFFVAVLLNPVRTGNYSWSSCMVLFGLAGGLILAGMMICLGKALEKGPPGLTFAALNSSTVMPMILMVLLFGAPFNYIYTLSNGLGSLLVVCGLFWAGWGLLRSEKMMQWASLITAAFWLHVVFLIFMQWRALFINFPGENGLFLSFDVDDALSQWFMPAVFFAAALVQIVVYCATQKRLPNRPEVMYGVLGGITNGIGTFFMICSTEASTPLEHAMIFPIFAVTMIILCNLWGQWLYKEKVNWLANGLCVAGVIIGTLDWKTVF
jgi:drug/metabolite transporter (DMT)-like permease